MTAPTPISTLRAGVGDPEDRQGYANTARASPLPRAGRQREHAPQLLQDGREPLPRLRRVGLHEHHRRPPGGSCGAGTPRSTSFLPLPHKLAFKKGRYSASSPLPVPLCGHEALQFHENSRERAKAQNVGVVSRPLPRTPAAGW